VSRGLLIGIVLAAGQSARMGRPKALLPTAPAGETFAARVVRILREGGVPEVVVIGRASDHQLRAEVAALNPAAGYLVNPEPERGQLSSLLVGIDYAQDRSAAGVLVMPVDIPLVRGVTIARSISAFHAGAGPIIRVVHEGRHGHPVIFRADTFDDLRTADMSVGASAVLRRHADQVVNLEVDDPGILRDVDVPEDYRRAFGREPF
jgi:molybdenum cofactor cytidylyltransferase